MNIMFQTTATTTTTTTKTKSGIEELTEHSYKGNLLKPGSLPHCEIETFHMDEDMVQKTCPEASWSNCDARTFEVRVGPNYVPGQKQPSEKAIYSVFACDGFKMESKVNHISRFMDIKPCIEQYKTPYHPKTWGLPPIIIINVMAPSYPPEMMSGKDNGEGYQLVFYARLSDEVREILDEYHDGKRTELPASVRLFNDFIHSSRGSHLRQRFKCIARIMNINNAGLNFLTKNLISQYNGKPFLARTSSTFYHEPGKYFAADIDAHLFGYPARKGLSYVKDSINSMIYDVGFVIEGHTNEELPERVLCCARVSRIGIDRAVPFPSELVGIASSKDASKSYSELHTLHILKKKSDYDVGEDDKKSEQNDIDDALKRIAAENRTERADMSMCSDTNDEEAKRIIKEITLQEQKEPQEFNNHNTDKNNKDNDRDHEEAQQKDNNTTTNIDNNDRNHKDQNTTMSSQQQQQQSNTNNAQSSIYQNQKEYNAKRQEKNSHNDH